jgi:CHAT domain-containing protein
MGAGELAVKPFIRYDGREEIVLPAMPVSRRAAFVVLAAALLAVAGWHFGGRALVASFRTRGAVQRLAEVAPRLPEARFSALTGTSQVRAGVTMRGRGDNVALKARAGDVLSFAAANPNAEGRSAEAVAQIMKGEWREAVSTLETAVEAQPNDPVLWSDLAAARYVRSTTAADDDVEGLLSALVAADRSRRIDPHNANALFNRALILEGLGLRTLAAGAWRAYLDVEEDPIRAADARRRLESIEGTTWNKVQPELERATEAGDMAAVETIVARFPQDARGYGEVIYLTNWANAYLKGDAATALKNLRVARALGAALRRRGETLLAEAVATIEATVDPDALRSIAVAQQAYDHGRDAFRDFHYVEAEPLFADAARGFADGHSPMEFVARAYTAFSIAGQERTQEGHDAMASIAAVVKAQPGHRALFAYIQWMFGRSELIRGRWDDAIAILRESRAIFTELGETKNVGAVDDILAEGFQQMGRPDLAWQHCIASFRGVSEEGNAFRLQVALAGGVRIAMGTRSWDAAASLLDLELAVAAEVRQAPLTADALRRLYIVQNERKDIEARDVALARARAAAAHRGAETKEQSADIDEAEAVVAMQSHPDRAVELITHALEFALSADRRLFVADLLRNRGRAYLAGGDMDAAAADFAAGVNELERQRGGIETAELRARFFDTADGLFADAIGLQVRRGDAAAAFQYADRARARSLLESNDAVAVSAPVDVPGMLAKRLPDTTLVEFAVLDGEVVVFCVRDGLVTMHRSPIAADALRTRIEELHRAIGEDPPARVQVVAAGLYEVLFGGVSDRIAATKSLIIVADGPLQHVPFEVLWQASTRQYLVQSHTIAIAPSAAVLTARNAPARSADSILLVGSGAGNEEESLGYLPSVKDEIATLRRVYRSSHVLLGAEASAARFASEAGAYDVIHFAGHGLSDDESLTASLLFSPGANGSGRMYMTDIARLCLPRAPLVVLAACGTLRGRAEGVEGMPSLARSFLAAGASTVIGTVRDVDDATAGGLLAAFHRSIAAGALPAAALRSAQLDAIARGGADAEPKNWAPYVVYTATP